jgi:hypothetical protein
MAGASGGGRQRPILRTRKGGPALRPRRSRAGSAAARELHASFAPPDLDTRRREAQPARPNCSLWLRCRAKEGHQNQTNGSASGHEGGLAWTSSASGGHRWCGDRAKRKGLVGRPFWKTRSCLPAFYLEMLDLDQLDGVDLDEDELGAWREMPRASGLSGSAASQHGALCLGNGLGPAARAPAGRSRLRARARGLPAPFMRPTATGRPGHLMRCSACRSTRCRDVGCGRCRSRDGRGDRC